MTIKNRPLTQRLLILGGSLTLLQLAGLAALTLALPGGELAAAVCLAGSAALVAACVVLWGRRADRAVEELRAILERVRNGHGDLSARVETHEPALSGLDQGLARLLGDFRETMADLRHRALDIAVEAARLRKTTGGAAERTAEQENYSQLVFQSSEETTRALEDISTRTNAMSSSNAENLESVRQSREELGRATDQITEMNQRFEQFAETVGRLTESARRISSIMEMVQGFSRQTNLLALNAAIEASRAGEAGRGFAVVAEEVRDLAGKVHSATDDINDIVTGMDTQVQETVSGSEQMRQYAADSRQAVSGATETFAGMVDALEKAHGELLAIGTSIEELTVTNQEIHSRSTEIRNLGQQVNEAMRESAGYSATLREATEASMARLAGYRTGQGTFETILETVTAYRDRFRDELEAMRHEGIDIWDQDYQCVFDGDPRKYTTDYTAAFQERFQQAIDRARDEIPGGAYLLLTDRQGYIAVHHGDVSEPPTGDPEHDRPRSRHQRIFADNDTEIRRARNTDPLLLQTYLRDTGEVLNDLSLPLVVGGHHWGAVICGFRPEVAMDRDA